MTRTQRILLGILPGVLAPGLLPAQPAARKDSVVPAVASLIGQATNPMRDVVERYTTDRAALGRRYPVDYSAERRARMRTFYESWRARLRETDFGRLDTDGRIDWVLLDTRTRYELELLKREEKLLAEMESLVPFAPAIMDLQERRIRLEPIDARAVAQKLASLAAQVDSLRKLFDRPAPGAGQNVASRASADSASVRPVQSGDTQQVSPTNARASRDPAVPKVTPIVALRAANTTTELRRSLEQWYKYYAGYDPIFTWWASESYGKLNKGLEAYVKTLREKLVGVKEGQPEPIIGDPIGTDGMAADLAVEMIAYTPQQLIAIAEREFAWCEAEMKKASRAMGFGDDWKAALEKVKNTYVEPGKQPELVRTLAHEAVRFVEQRGLVTVPPLAKEIWRMEMLSPEQQRVSPFFLGGEIIRVSYPTDAMSYEDKMMSMRGNNPHFSRATVHHELIPGHHLQGFMTARYNSHRRAFSTPFWTEGWALYWEMLLWDAGFPRTPEDRVGMLFWRMHRAARIIFSLNFHLGNMTPQQAVDFLVERVGHERANAEGEVRRSFNGSYSPLYQVAYMIGGLQIRALHRELVGSGRMTDRQFHDTILQSGPMPIAMVRARLLGRAPAREYVPDWRFAGDF